MGEIDLPVVNHDDCQDSLRKTRLGKKFKLHDSFVCAGGINGKDTCKGDGGSPLVCPSKYDPNTYIQAITCHNGGGNSYFGYTSNVCQTWLDDKISSLTIKRDAAGNFARVFDAMINGYKKCSVTWEQPTAPLVDISDFSRDSAGYPNVDTSEKLVETESY